MSDVSGNDDSVDSLDLLIQRYLADNAYQQEQQQVVREREETLPFYRDLVWRFVDGELDLHGLRDGFRRLYQDRCWRATGPGFLTEFRRLVSNHLPSKPDLEANLRFILTDLSADNVGQKIEQFYNLMVNEEERLRLLGSEKTHVAAGNSAFIISLLACWLTYPDESYIYYWSLRVGLASLINTGFIPAPKEITIGPKGIVVTSDAEYQIVVRVLDQLGLIAPQLKNGPFWAERFLDWITARLAEKPDFLKNILIFIDGSEAESDADDDPVADSADDSKADTKTNTSTTDPSAKPPEPAVETFEDAWLQAIPEEELQQAITAIRRHILVDETVIRRIYQALLNGHVILTGPPGTGKTELARLIPELLWSFHEQGQYAYTTQLVTATSDWSTRTLISGIVPIVSKDRVAYKTQYGHLAQAVLDNWNLKGLQNQGVHNGHRASVPTADGRVRIKTSGFVDEDVEREYRGRWLIIDEFNRAPIDAALGEALTVLSNGGALQVPVDGRYLSLPLPKDFRIIGTLNSFDRSYLNQISEALKRRFSFVEVPPPTRAQRDDEQNIVLYKALERCQRFSSTIERIEEDNGSITLRWPDVLSVGSEEGGFYQSTWGSNARGQTFSQVFHDVLWPLFEVIRIYRQLGTAQLITLVAQTMTPCLLQNTGRMVQWLAALDSALCDTIADQLQVLLPDELDVLLWYLRLDEASFDQRYNDALSRLKERRLAAHLTALSLIVDEHGRQYISDDDVEALLEQEDEAPLLPSELLHSIFHLERPLQPLPQFTRRLRTFKAERGL